MFLDPIHVAVAAIALLVIGFIAGYEMREP